MPELLAFVERSAFEGISLRFGYRDRNGRRSTRHVEPHDMLMQLPVWYLRARDIYLAAPRAFRMDRIADPALESRHAFSADFRGVHSLLPSVR